MTITLKTSLMSLVAASLLTFTACGTDTNTDETAGEHEEVSDAVIAEQHEKLAESLTGNEGPQAPRDIDLVAGDNNVTFDFAPKFSAMNLCDIHFHKSAEHKGGEFTTYAGNGDGEGYGSGYKYDGNLTELEKTAFTGLESEVFTNEHNPLYSGDTIEVHYVYTSNSGDRLGHGLGTCLDVNGTSKFLRVEAQVYVVVNDENALDFTELNKIETNATTDFKVASHIPTGPAVEYLGSTTGPGYNEKVSPYQVTWNVHKEVKKVYIETVGEWINDNKFDETHPHGVRNLVTNPKLLSTIN